MNITEAEAAIMQVLWQQSPRSGESIFEAVRPMHAWREGTVKSLLNRLLKKGAVSVKRDGRRYLYSPALSRSEYVSEASRSLIDRLFGGQVAPLVAHFSEQHELSRNDVAELKRLIEGLDDERR